MASISNPFSRLVNQDSPVAVARLAVLEPSADPDSPIRLTLTDAPLASTSYESISFDHEAEATSKVLVDDAEQEIPKSLEEALRIFRRREQPRKVWADLLVGRTVEERNAQGPFIRQILAHADKTLCWLGPDGDDAALTARAFDVIRDIANRYLQACLHVGLSQDTSISRATLQQMQGIRERLNDCPYDDLHSFDFALWKLIDSVLGAPYWASVHTIPDIVSAQLPIIVRGRSNIRWPNYVAASRGYPFFRAKFFGGVPMLPPVQKGFEMVFQIEIAARRKRLGQSVELFPMIQTARDCGAKDVRENVFAMLKIATPSARIQSHNQGPQPLPAIDYAKSAQQVFTEAARYTVLERQDLMLWFAECPPCQKLLKGLPSWVPDFGSTFPKGRNVGSPNKGMRGWWDMLNPIKPLTVSDDGDNPALHVQAYGLARIAHVSPVFDGGNLTRLCYTEFEKLPPPETWETQEQRNERFWRTLVLNSGGSEMEQTLADDTAPGPAVGDSFRSMMAHERIMALLECTPLQLQSPSPELLARFQANPEAMSLVAMTGNGGSYESLLRSFALGRRFFRTEDGRFGMTTVEDVVAVDGKLAPERQRSSATKKPATAAGGQSSSSGDSTGEDNDANSSQPEAGAPPRPNLGRMMADPMARAMLEGFQQFLTTRDPNAANLVSQMVRGDLPPCLHGKEQKAEGKVGGFFPYVLRPVVVSQEQEQHAAEDAAGGASSGSNPLAMADDATYEFVGDCYLYGAMDGEDFSLTSPTGEKFFRVDTSKIVDIRIV
ncbi:HET-domain-containing protein [Apiospora sp. TS-2023a]